jgi:hypothetical protein
METKRKKIASSFTTDADSPQGLSKLANILFTKEIQKRFDAEGIPAISISLHPGGVLTGK